MVKFGIIGAGIIGITTATVLHDVYPDADIILHAAETGANITSYGVPGIFRPDPIYFPGHQCDCLMNQFDDCSLVRWTRSGKERYWNLVTENDCNETGVHFHPTYQLFENENVKEPFISKFCGKVSKLEEDEISSQGFSNEIKSAYFYMTCIIEPRFHIPYLLKKLNQSTHFQMKTGVENDCLYSSISDITSWTKSNKIDVIFNCTGLGAGQLFSDSEMCPLKGQLIRVYAPWMKFGFCGPNDTYVYTGKQDVIIGGYRELLSPVKLKPVTKEDYYTPPEITEQIMNKVKNMWKGSINKSQVIEKWTGLRPFRSMIRVEIEWIKSDLETKSIPIIHNYGHGSCGVALSWGTVQDAVKLATEALRIM